MAAPTIVSGFTTASRATNGTSITINVPTNASGDMIFVAYTSDGDNDTATLTGFTALYSNIAFAATSGIFCLFYKTSTGDSGTYTVNNTVSERAAAFAFAVRSTTGINATGTTALATVLGTSVTIPAVTTTVADCLRISIAASNKDSRAYGTASGHTVIGDVGVLSGGAITVQYKTVATASTDASTTISQTLSEYWAGMSFALAPVASGTSYDNSTTLAATMGVVDSGLLVTSPSVALATGVGASDGSQANVGNQATLPVTVSLVDSSLSNRSVSVPLPVAAALVDSGALSRSGSVALPVSTNLVDSAALVGSGSAALPITASLADSAVRVGSGSVALPVSAALVDSATRVGLGSVAIPVTATLVDAAVLVGAASVPIAVAVNVTPSSAGSGFGAAVNLPITAGMTQSGLISALSTTALAIAAALADQGQLDAGNQVTIGVTVVVDSSRQEPITLTLTLPVSASTIQSGLRQAIASTALAAQVDATPAATATLLGATELATTVLSALVTSGLSIESGLTLQISTVIVASESFLLVIVTPQKRIHVVEIENRRMEIAGVRRSLTVDSEVRMVTIPALTRSMAVWNEARIIDAEDS